MAIVISNAAQWHEFEPGVRFLLAPLTISRMRGLLKEADGDSERLERLMAVAVVQDWDGIVDDRNEPLPVTPENKQLICDVREINAWITAQAKGFRTVALAEVKN